VSENPRRQVAHLTRCTAIGVRGEDRKEPKKLHPLSLVRKAYGI
jgi:hypothetical protein